KTGFFLDHREMRQWIGELSKGKKVLNAFSYTGGFSVYALAGGAESVDSIDCSQEAINACKEHVALNGFQVDQQRFICRDVFDFLREESSLPYNLVILDPPAFAKKQKDLIAACRGYKDINRLTIQKMPPQSLLLTCSCSYHVNEELFQKILFQAASEAKRQVRIVGRHRLAPDHPVNLYHPESNYLKSFLLYVE
ncbi:MAG: class I SAM-dependent methyltransferase, partial [Parachlamydiaceae bacterium]|nr:class I SAM-dependent methyltransferase [Parachlamydiaceae bacterium]